MGKKVYFPLTDAQRAFLEQNYGLLVVFASKLARYRRDLSYDDSLGLVHLVAVCAIQDYTPDKCAWSTFLWQRVRSELSHRDAWRNAKSRKAVSVFLSDEMLNYYVPNGEHVIAEADSNMDAQLIVSAMKAVAGEEATRLYLRRCIGDETFQALSAELGVTRQCVQQRISKMNVQFRTKFSEEKQWQGIVNGTAMSSPR